MLTRRDKLLNRPWQLRRYNNHRYKVLNAVPAIDFGPPVERSHVTCKLKKLQWEGERRLRIEEENFKLLQRMGSIMKKNRLENHWQSPPPDFLHRVGIYPRTRSPTPYREVEESPEKAVESLKRRGCSACTPSSPVEPAIPEERVPWSPPKLRLSRRRTSSPAVKPISDFDFPKLTEKKGTVEGKLMPIVSSAKTVKTKSKSKNANKKFDVAEKCLVLTQGRLNVAINLPPYADVKIVTGKENKFVQRSYCQCKSFSP